MQFIGVPLLIGINPDTVEAVDRVSELQSIRVQLSPEDHQRFRVEAAKEGRSMAAVARRLVEDYLSKRQTGGKA